MSRSADEAPSLATLGLPATVTELLTRARQDAPDREAVVTGRVRLTYAALNREVERAAAALHGLGLRAGDRLGVAMGNDAGIAVLFFAAMRLGAVWVGINLPLAPPEKEFILRDADVRLLVGEPEVIAELRQLDVAGRVRSATIAPGDPECEWSRTVAATPADATAPPSPRSPFEPAVISYTSGTTGRPKGVVQSEHNILLPGAVLSQGPEWGLGARIGVCLPLTISNMMVMGPLMTAQTSAACVCTDRLAPRELAAWVARERIESMTLVPTMLHDLVVDDGIDPASLVSLRFVQTGGGPWSTALLDRFSERFGIRVVGTYGLTEAPTNVALEARDLPRVPGASGRPNPHLAVSIRSEAGTPMVAGEVGEVCVGAATSGAFAGVYRTMLGYLGNPEATATALAGGVLHTGDRGFLDPEGNLHLVGRGSDLIIRGGANVYPAEVELVLADHPGVVGAAVVGVRDERLGERVVAAVEGPGPIDAEALRLHCSERLARYKVPSAFVPVERLPRNSMGKVIRSEVRALIESELTSTRSSARVGRVDR